MSLQRTQTVTSRQGRVCVRARARACTYPGGAAVQLQSVMGRVCQQHQLHLLQLLPAARRQDPGRLLHTQGFQLSLVWEKRVCFSCASAYCSVLPQLLLEEVHLGSYGV